MIFDTCSTLGYTCLFLISLPPLFTFIENRTFSPQISWKYVSVLLFRYIVRSFVFIPRCSLSSFCFLRCRLRCWIFAAHSVSSSERSARRDWAWDPTADRWHHSRRLWASLNYCSASSTPCETSVTKHATAAGVPWHSSSGMKTETKTPRHFSPAASWPICLTRPALRRSLTFASQLSLCRHSEALRRAATTSR